MVWPPPPPTRIPFSKGVIHAVSAAASQRAKAADIHGQRCLIENVSPKRAIKMGHVLEREMGATDIRVALLEWSWNMHRNTLNLDTRRNIFFIGATLLQLYNEHRWALVPVESILDQYFDETKQKALPRGEFPTLDAESYTYRLIPLQNMEEVYMTRQKDLPDGKRDVAIHRFPFAEFPLIASHIDPKFAIAHIGHVLSGDTRAVADFEYNILFNRVKMPAETREALIEKYPILGKVWTLFQAWTSPLPEGWENEESYVMKVEGEEYQDDCDEWSEPSSDGDSVCTPNRRIKAWLDEEEEQKQSKGKGKEKAVEVEVEEKSPSEVLKEIAAAAMADVPEPTTPPNRRKKKLTAFPPVPPEQLVASGPSQPPLAVEAGPSVPVDPVPPRKKRAAPASKNPRKRKSEKEPGPEAAAPARQNATTTENKAAPAANPNKRRRGAASKSAEAEVKAKKEKPAPAKRHRGAAATSKAVVEPEAEVVRAEAEVKPAAAKRGRGKASTSKAQVQADVQMEVEVEEAQVEADVAPAATKRKRAVASKLDAKSEIQPEESAKAEGSKRKPAKDVTHEAKKGERSAPAAAAAAAAELELEEPVRKTGRVLRKRA